MNSETITVPVDESDLSARATERNTAMPEYAILEAYGAVNNGVVSDKLYDFIDAANEHYPLTSNAQGEMQLYSETSNDPTNNLYMSVIVAHDMDTLTKLNNDGPQEAYDKVMEFLLDSEGLLLPAQLLRMTAPAADGGNSISVQVPDVLAAMVRRTEQSDMPAGAQLTDEERQKSEARQQSVANKVLTFDVLGRIRDENPGLWELAVKAAHAKHIAQGGRSMIIDQIVADSNGVPYEPPVVEEDPNVTLLRLIDYAMSDQPIPAASPIAGIVGADDYPKMVLDARTAVLITA